MTTTQVKFYAMYLPANQVWQVMFGDTPISVNGRFLFSKEDLDAELKACGLTRGAKTNEIYMECKS